MDRKHHAVVTVLTIVIFTLAFMLNSRLYFRFDLTSNKAYTLSETSRNLHREINGILRITYYVSDRLVSGHPIPEEITGLLKEYASRSRGKIQFSRKDPIKANSTLEMESLGIMPQTVRLLENSEIITLEVYTGIVLEYLDKIEILPLAFSMETLEYDITTRILSMARGREKELGVITGNVSARWNIDYALLNFALQRAGFRIRIIAPGEEIPETLPLLFVIDGADILDEWALYRIDRYIQSGGNVLFAQDSLTVDMTSGLEIRPIMDKGLLAMISSYGAAVLPALVLDNSSLQISYEEREGSREIRTVPYPEWISITAPNMNSGHPVTGNLNGPFLYWASPLELAPPQGIAATSLFTSAPDAWLQTRDFNANPVDLSLLKLEENQTKGRKILGAALSGIFPSFFEGMIKPEREGSLARLPDMPAAPAPARLIIVGDTDFTGSMMEVGGGEARNLEFLVRSAEWLFHTEETIGLRRVETGGLDRIADTGRRKIMMDFSRTLNVFILPGIAVIAGFVILRKRKNKTTNPGQATPDGKQKRIGFPDDV